MDMSYLSGWPRVVIISATLAFLTLMAACSSYTPPVSSPTSTTPNSGAPPITMSAAGAVTIDLVAQNISFNLKTIMVTAGAAVTIDFTNKDNVLHSFSVYTNSSATPPAIFQGQIVQGPGTATYHFTAPTKPGTYFFRCDIHPTIMHGDFIVN